MTARADLLKDDFRIAPGLDRVYGRVLYHVSGVTGWTPSNTGEKVLAVVPFTLGAAWPDPALSRAICTQVSLVDGPWMQADGTAEAMVALVFDSDRRWGGAFFEAASARGRDYDIEIPSFTRTPLPVASGDPFNYEFMSVPFTRSLVRRVEPRDATGISEDQKRILFAHVGSVFNLFNINYIYRSPDLYVARTNQTILHYYFETTSPIPAFAANSSPGFHIATPALSYLEEYSINRDSRPPTIGKRSAMVGYGGPQDPTSLPFWEARLR